jgi:hypothetical protein
MGGFLKTPNPSRTPPPANVQTRVQEHAGRIVLSPIVLMSSGRLFLDRVGRHQSPSLLHRHVQNKSIAGSKGTIYHRTVSSVLTVCLTFRDKRTCTPTTIAYPLASTASCTINLNQTVSVATTVNISLSANRLSAPSTVNVPAGSATATFNATLGGGVDYYALTIIAGVSGVKQSIVVMIGFPPLSRSHAHLIA